MLTFVYNEFLRKYADKNHKPASNSIDARIILGIFSVLHFQFQTTCVGRAVVGLGKQNENALCASLSLCPKLLNFVHKLCCTGGSRLMRISLLRISLLRFFKKIPLCEFVPYALGYFISLVRFFGYFCPIWLMRILANANFFQNQKSHQARTLCTLNGMS